ncbi:MAG: methyltransferase domain-containing protein [Acidobacteria bacterium]|nr:methyltransferase domain-containing protein [Acidobacteriota bacterium]
MTDVPRPGADAEWDAETYHRVSAPQTAWGRAVLDRIELHGDETIIDAGCGSGRLTSEILGRVPHGRIIAVDSSSAMIEAARRHLAGEPAAPRVWLIRADVASLPFQQIAHVIFSTATFHWVLNHLALFRSLFVALRPGGRLVAQCGGGPNIERVLAHATSITSREPFASVFRHWQRPWEFADDTTTKSRLHQVGFVDVETSLVPAPTSFADAGQFREFVKTVVVRPHLTAIGNPSDGDTFLQELVSAAGSDDPPYTLDYWRLNISARRPAGQRR